MFGGKTRTLVRFQVSTITPLGCAQLVGGEWTDQNIEGLDTGLRRE